jgi:hypothetical protein
MCFDCDEINESKRSFLKGATAAAVGLALNAQAFGQQATPESFGQPKCNSSTRNF